ncbi:MAG: HD domain-containing protein [Lachnospiraceae bacterium]
MGFLKDPLYRTCLSKIALFERDRIFCGHDMAHFLDVARLAYIFNLEENLGIEKEEIYTAALLHDVGRFVQYEDGTPHQLAGLPLQKSSWSVMATKKKRKRAFYGPLRITGTERSGRKKSHGNHLPGG